MLIHSQSAMVRSFLALISLSSLLIVGILALPVEEVDEYRQAKTALSKTCPKNSQWNECSNICPKSCANFDTINACFSLRCGAPGCGCKEGHILRDASDQSKGCVTREVCRDLRAKGQL